jgi:hypothetical protein
MHFKLFHGLPMPHWDPTCVKSLGLFYPSHELNDYDVFMMMNMIEILFKMGASTVTWSDSRIQDKYD